MIGKDTDEIILELVDSFLDSYQEDLEQSMKEICVEGSTQLILYRGHILITDWYIYIYNPIAYIYNPIDICIYIYNMHCKSKRDNHHVPKIVRIPGNKTNPEKIRIKTFK